MSTGRGNRGRKSRTLADADPLTAATLTAVRRATCTARSSRRRLSGLTAYVEFITALAGVTSESGAVCVLYAWLTCANRPNAGARLGVGPRCRQSGNRRDEHGRRPGKCQLANQLASRDIDKRRRRSRGWFQQVGVAQLFECQRKESLVLCNPEPNGQLGRDTFARPSTFLEQLEYARRRRIEQMNSIVTRIVYEYLIVESVTQQAGSNTRKVHANTAKWMVGG